MPQKKVSPSVLFDPLHYIRILFYVSPCLFWFFFSRFSLKPCTLLKHTKETWLFQNLLSFLFKLLHLHLEGEPLLLDTRKLALKLPDGGVAQLNLNQETPNLSFHLSSEHLYLLPQLCWFHCQCNSSANKQGRRAVNLLVWHLET